MEILNVNLACRSFQRIFKVRDWIARQHHSCDFAHRNIQHRKLRLFSFNKWVR